MARRTSLKSGRFVPYNLLQCYITGLLEQKTYNGLWIRHQTHPKPKRAFAGGKLKKPEHWPFPCVHKQSKSKRNRRMVMVRKSFSDDYQKLDMMLIIFKYFWRGKTRIQMIWNMEMHKCRGSLVGCKIFISNKFSGNEDGVPGELWNAATVNIYLKVLFLPNFPTSFISLSKWRVL